AKSQARGRAAVDAQLVLDGDATHVVARAWAAVVVDQDLGHDEQRDALDTLRRARRAGQHEVHDVVREVVLAVSDEDLLAVQPKAPIGLRHGPRPYRRKVRAGLRLREVHRAGPFAAHELGQVAALLRLGAAQLQRLDGAVRE